MGGLLEYARRGDHRHPHSLLPSPSPCPLARPKSEPTRLRSWLVAVSRSLTGPHAFGPKYVYIGHKILMKQPYDCRYQPMGARPNGALFKKTERKLKSPTGAPRITEQPRRHGSSARYIRDPMTQGYRPRGACRSCGTIPRRSSRSPGSFLVVSHSTIWTTVITLQIPPVTYGPRTSSV